MNELTHYLKTHARGAKNAISASSLCARLGVSDREIRTLVNEARLEHGVPIVSLDQGYYWPTSPDDEGALHCISKLRAHALAELAISTAIERGLGKLRVEQMSLGV